MNQTRESKILNSKLVEYYEISIEDLIKISQKGYLLKGKTKNDLFLKFAPYNASDKYSFLEDVGLDNVLYPYINKENHYVSTYENGGFYLTDYFPKNKIPEEMVTQNMLRELNKVHNSTQIKKQLSSRLARPKFEEITKQLDYKFNVIEEYVRGVESNPLDVFSMPVLGNYQHLLDCKKEMIRLQKRIISCVKGKEKVDYVYVHNRPTLDHLLNVRGVNYLISLENGRIGINSLDLAKFYVQNENVNVDFHELIVVNIFNEQNGFYYDYFRFLVLFLYVKKLIITREKYITAQSFVNVTNSIKKYFQIFLDNKEDISKEDEEKDNA